MDTAVDVQLLTHTPDPIRVMYVAFRTCYSKFTPQQIWADIESGKISEEKMKSFIFDKLKSGHSSPRTQIYFTFAVSGLSRAASHQLVRHNNGITFDQQSQRYYAFKEADFPFVVPETWEQAGLRDEYLAFMHRVGELYDQALKAGVPAEDARFLLPNAASTNLTFTVNFEEFLHIADLRLCWRAPDPAAQGRDRGSGQGRPDAGVEPAERRGPLAADAQTRVREGSRRNKLATSLDILISLAL